MRFSVAEIVAFLSRHVELGAGRPDRHRHAGPARVAAGPDRHLQAGDVVRCWIEGIGELTTHVA